MGICDEDFAMGICDRNLQWEFAMGRALELSCMANEKGVEELLIAVSLCWEGIIVCKFNYNFCSSSL